jgi:lipopolysaccharide export system protein LptA
MSLLIGRVRYRDPSRELIADEARYFTEVGRLQATGHVAVENRVDSSRVENGDLVYLRQTDFRAEESMTFTTGADGLRPRATILPRGPDTLVADSAADVTDSVDAVVADTTSADATVADTTATPTDTTAVDTADVAAPSAVDASAVGPPPVDTATVREASAKRDRSPYIVVGDRITFLGTSYFNASGRVEIERDSLLAFADSAEYTGESESLDLVGSARVVSSEYTLVGRTISMRTDAAGTNEVRAVQDALLTGEDLTLTAPVIKLYLVDGAVDRLVAVPLRTEAEDSVAPEMPSPRLDSAASARTDAVAGSFPPGVAGSDPLAADSASGSVLRPLAVSEGFELTADSLDLTTTEGSVEEIFSAGRARSVSYGRGVLNVEALPELARQDWLEGDTIVIDLLPVAGDSTPADGQADREYEIERIVARVGARSLYRLPAQDSTAQAGVDAPALHYVVGDEITIHMKEGEVEAMEVVGQTRGVHLEPLGRPPAPPDTAAADTAAVARPEPGGDR